MPRLRIAFFGSGSFGIPTLHALTTAHDVVGVISQPDRPAGRGRAFTPTPVAAWASARKIPVQKPDDVNTRESIGMVKALDADAFVVIAFGQKLGEDLLGKTFAINLHASLLPAYRGAAPINWAIVDGHAKTGVSVISLAARMDAGLVYATRETEIGLEELAGELHDRLALLGVDPVLETLDAHAKGTLKGATQDDSKATRARKLRRADGTVDPRSMSADEIRCRVHGLSPWPGVDVLLGGEALRLVRVRSHRDRSGTPGTLLADGTIGCASGCLELLEVQPPGARAMAFGDWRRGRRIETGATVMPAPIVPNAGASVG
ncbi:MAG: methionyl-tRNA formyltransferase [Phycisphaerae bacterium]|nr:methionyl-tRNA formyltransferase [Phycisphaerae bacterium]